MRKSEGFKMWLATIRIEVQRQLKLRFPYFLRILIRGLKILRDQGYAVSF